VLVILRINRGATHVKWSPQENKFAVGCGAKCVAVCYFEEDNDWWVSKHIKKHQSTVMKVDWHPNNALLVTASTDFKCRVFSVFIKGVDKGAPNSPWGNNLPFGELCCEIESTGWVQSCAWSPSGNLIGFIGQNSTMNVADVSSGTAQVQSVKYSNLPFRDLLFYSENSIIAAGHDFTPVHFKNQGGWKCVGKLDTGNGAHAAPALSSTQATRKMFVDKVDRGESVSDAKLETKHQNCITNVQKYSNSQYSTSGLDGVILIWDLPK